jgi:hypothetical protein
MTEKHTERTVFEALHRRYRQFNGNSNRWVHAEHPRNGTGFYGWSEFSGRCVGPLRTADFVALDMWESAGHRIIGHEVKVSRSDWRRELADPTKGEAWAQWCHEWYVVAPRGVVPRAELPVGWGLIEVTDFAGADAVHGTRMAKRSARPDPVPMPVPVQFGLMRAIETTALRRTEERPWQP